MRLQQGLAQPAGHGELVFSTFGQHGLVQPGGQFLPVLHGSQPPLWQPLAARVSANDIARAILPSVLNIERFM